MKRSKSYVIVIIVRDHEFSSDMYTPYIVYYCCESPLPPLSPKISFRYLFSENPHVPLLPWNKIHSLCENDSSSTSNTNSAVSRLLLSLNLMTIVCVFLMKDLENVLAMILGNYFECRREFSLIFISRTVE